MSDITGLIYAGIIVAGGVLGYVKSGSTASLTAGLVCGGAAGVAAAFDNNPMLLVVSSGLTLVMGSRFYQSGKFMPAGIVTALSLVMVIRCLVRHFR